MQTRDLAHVCLIGLTVFGGGGCDRAQPPATLNPPASLDSPVTLDPIAPQSEAGGPNEALLQTAYIKAPNSGPGDRFGTGGTLSGDAVALSADGGTLAIGAPFESSSAAGVNGDQDDETAYAAGAVYVFVRDDAESWEQQAYVKASNPGFADNFGYFVALSADGNTLAVSGRFEASSATGVDGDQDDDSVPQAGTVYVFSRVDGAWSQEAYIKASNTGEAGRGNELGDGDQFGFSLALSADGHTLAVGAIAEDSAAAGIDGDQSDNSAMSAGAVYLYTRTDTAWTQQAYIKPTNPGGGDLFGYAVSLTADGNMLAVGAYDEDGSLAGTNEFQDDETSGTGAIYVFTRGGNAWAQTAYLKASNAETGDSLGATAAISAAGNTLATTSLDEDGATTGVNSTPVPDTEPNVSMGSVYVFVRDGDNWSEQAYVKASNTGLEDSFGARLALSGDGDTLAVGAQLEDSAARGIDGEQDDDSAQEAGVVYLFTRDGATWSQIAYVKGSNTEAFDEFGSSIALSGDGSSMAVGARGEDSAATGVGGDQDDNSSFESGAVYVFQRAVASD